MRKNSIKSSPLRWTLHLINIFDLLLLTVIPLGACMVVWLAYPFRHVPEVQEPLRTFVTAIVALAILEAVRRIMTKRAMLKSLEARTRRAYLMTHMFEPGFLQYTAEPMVPNFLLHIVLKLCPEPIQRKLGLSFGILVGPELEEHGRLIPEFYNRFGTILAKLKYLPLELLEKASAEHWEEFNLSNLDELEKLVERE